MSNNPNSPFGNPNDSFGNNPTPKKSNTWLWVLGIIGGIGILGAIVCCGGSFALYRAGSSALAEQLKQNLAGHPTINDQIGDIQSMSMDLIATGKAGEAKPGTIAFKIEGSKGSGFIEIHQDELNRVNQGQGLSSAELVMSNGTRYPLGSDSPEFVPEEDTGIQLNQFDENLNPVEPVAP